MGSPLLLAGLVRTACYDPAVVTVESEVASKSRLWAVSPNGSLLARNCRPYARLLNTATNVHLLSFSLPFPPALAPSLSLHLSISPASLIARKRGS